MNDTKFMIGGTIVADDAQRYAFEDVTPVQVRSVLEKLDKGEGITFEISSPGGDVTAGLAIANLIKAASVAGHASKAHVVGIAASMASVIACACDEIEIDESAFMMIHNPWTVAQGDAEELRKSADLLDKMRDSILSFYRSKFEKTDDELIALMDAETWFTGKDAADFGFKATVIPNAEPLKAAACARSLPNFAKIPETAAGLFILGKHEETKMEEPKDEQQQQEVTVEVAPAAEPTAADGSEPADETAAPKAEDNPVEAPAPEAKVEDKPVETPAPEAKAEKTVDEIVSERLAGAMKSRDTEINNLKAQLATDQKAQLDTMAKLEKDFNDKLEAKEKELISAKAEITRLAADLETAKKELTETSSALDASNKALAVLNANVNTPSANATRKVNARDYLAKLPAKERQAFYSAHRHEVDNNLSVSLAE